MCGRVLLGLEWLLIAPVDRTVAALLRLWQRRGGHRRLDRMWDHRVNAWRKLGHRTLPITAPELKESAPEWVPNDDVWVRWDRIRHEIVPEGEGKVGCCCNVLDVVWRVCVIALLVIVLLPVWIVGSLLGIPLRYVNHACGVRPETRVWRPRSQVALVDHMEWDGRLALVTLNAALTEFEIMNVINHLPSSRPRCTQLCTWLTRTLPLIRGPTDVLCLQEVFDPHLAASLARELGVLGYHTVAQLRAPSGHGMNSGLMLASRWPIVAHGFDAFNVADGVDKLARKGLLIAKLLVSDAQGGRGPLVAFVTTTHMQAGGTVETKEEQWEAAQRWIDDWVQQHTSGDDVVVATILCGDFNVRLWSDADSNPALVVPSWDVQSVGSMLNGPRWQEAMTTTDAVPRVLERDVEGMDGDAVRLLFVDEGVCEDPYLDRGGDPQASGVGSDTLLVRQRDTKDDVVNDVDDDDDEEWDEEEARVWKPSEMGPDHLGTALTPLARSYRHYVSHAEAALTYLARRNDWDDKRVSSPELGLEWVDTVFRNSDSWPHGMLQTALDAWHRRVDNPLLRSTMAADLDSECGAPWQVAGDRMARLLTGAECRVLSQLLNGPSRRSRHAVVRAALSGCQPDDGSGVGRQVAGMLRDHGVAPNRVAFVMRVCTLCVSAVASGVYAQSGAIDHVMLRRPDSEASPVRNWRIVRQTGVPFGTGGILSDHAYVRVLLEQRMGGAFEQH